MESKKIAIIGGGLAGQFAALAYKKHFPNAEITLIYSSEIPIIGVGESGILDLPRFLFFNLGLDMNSFYREVQPLHKLGVSFVDWYKKGTIYNYTFDCGVSSDYFQNDLSMLPNNRKTLCANMMYHNLSPIQRDKSVMVGANSFQLENKKFVAWLEKNSKARGVKFIDAKVQEIAFVDRSQNEISYLKFKGSDEKVSFDFYAVASGFYGVIHDFLENEFVNFKPWLPCDRAVVGQHELNENDIRHSYTYSWRMSNGWMWQIDCPYRTGKGYVFDSTTQSDEEAVEEYKEKNSGRIKEPRIIDFKTGFYKKRFAKNFALVGNCQGFAEPLESTGFSMIIKSIETLIDVQKSNMGNLELSPSGAKVLSDYNEHFWWEIVDFLTLHYKYNYDWDNPFWNKCNNELKLRDEFNDLITYFKENHYYTNNYTATNVIRYSFIPRNSMFDIPGIIFHLHAKSQGLITVDQTQSQTTLEHYDRAVRNFVKDSEIFTKYDEIDFFEMYKNNSKGFNEVMNNAKMSISF